MSFVRKTLADHIEIVKQLETLEPLITQVANHWVTSLKNSGKILWMGNGGSAADSQHMAAELVGRFERERQALPSLALTTDTSILTSLSNDYAYDRVFARQIEAFGRKGDVVMALSTSGGSQNVIQGVRTARDLGAMTIGLTGQSGGELKENVDLCLRVPSSCTARIQEAHTLICHMICGYVEEQFDPALASS